jgi:hypothetical protein
MKDIDHSNNNRLTTDDLAFSAYLRMKGYRLIKSNPTKSKSIFTFEIGDEEPEVLKMQFINSEFLVFYNEIRNLKKLF